MTIKELKGLITCDKATLAKLLSDESWKNCSFRGINFLEVQEMRLREKIEANEASLAEQLEEMNLLLQAERFLEISTDGKSVKGNCNELFFSKAKELTIPDGIEVIEPEAFKNCPFLTTVIIPSTLKEIKAGAFENCNNLESLSGIECSKLTYIGKRAFARCERLVFLHLPETLEEIDDEAFHKAGLGLGLELQGISLHTIGDRAFQFSEISAFEPPKSLKRLGESALSGCSNLREAYLTPYILQIPENCFKDCSQLNERKMLEHQDFLVKEALIATACKVTEVEVDSLNSGMAASILMDLLYSPGPPFFKFPQIHTGIVAETGESHRYVVVTLNDDWWYVDGFLRDGDITVLKGKLPDWLELCE